MTAQGHSSGKQHGGDKRANWKDIGRELGGFSVAELVSEGVWMGAIALEDQIIPEKLFKDTSRILSKIAVEPYLDTIEHGLAKVCKLKECQPDMTKPHEERAELLANTIIKILPAMGLAWAAKLGVRRYANDKMGLEPEKKTKSPNHRWWLPRADEAMLFLCDEGAQIGALYVMNNPMAQQTDQMIATTSKFLQNTTNMSKHKADELAIAGVVWGGSNAIGATGAAVSMVAHRMYGMPYRLFDWLKGKSGPSGA